MRFSISMQFPTHSVWAFLWMYDTSNYFTNDLTHCDVIILSPDPEHVTEGARQPTDCWRDPGDQTTTGIGCQYGCHIVTMTTVTREVHTRTRRGGHRCCHPCQVCYVCVCLYSTPIIWTLKSIHLYTELRYNMLIECTPILDSNRTVIFNSEFPDKEVLDNWGYSNM